MTQIPPGYTDCWTPIESNPEIFTQLAHNLGLSKSLSFQDIWSLDPDSIIHLPRPICALILVFPTDDKYDERTRERDTTLSADNPEGILWFKQTIHNACGLYGLLHAVCNGDARSQIQPGTTLSTILDSYSTTQPTERYSLLSSPALKAAYLAAAQDGDTEAPANAADEVDFHYTCFAKSDSRLWELNGDLSGPVDMGGLEEGEDVLSESALGRIRGFMEVNGGDGIGFSMLALGPNLGD